MFCRNFCLGAAVAAFGLGLVVGVIIPSDFFLFVVGAVLIVVGAALCRQR